MNPFDGFQFDNDTALDKYVELKPGLNTVTLVLEGNATFTLDLNNPVAKCLDIGRVCSHATFVAQIDPTQFVSHFSIGEVVA